MPSKRKQLPEVALRGVVLHAVTERQCVDYILDELDAGCGGWVITPNLDHLRRASVDADYRALLSEGDLVVADGMPLIWASRVQGTPLPERVAGSSTCLTLAEGAAARGRSVFLLGGDPGAWEKAGQKLTEMYTSLLVAGGYCPPRGFENDPKQMQIVRSMLQEAKPDLIYVALGSPKQERLIRELRGQLPHAWWLGVGISLSFISGDVKRAPRWVQKIGMEWLHRLIQEPRRLVRRYLIDGIPFAASLLASSAWARVTRRGAVGAAA